MKSYVIHEKFPVTKDGMIEAKTSLRVLFIPGENNPQFFVDRKNSQTNDATLVESFYCLDIAMQLFEAEYKDDCLKLEKEFPAFKG